MPEIVSPPVSSMEKVPSVSETTPTTTSGIQQQLRRDEEDGEPANAGRGFSVVSPRGECAVAGPPSAVGAPPSGLELFSQSLRYSMRGAGAGSGAGGGGSGPVVSSAATAAVAAMLLDRAREEFRSNQLMGSGCAAALGLHLPMHEEDRSEAGAGSGRPRPHPANGRLNLLMDLNSGVAGRIQKLGSLRSNYYAHKAIRCTVPSCSCDCFTPGKSQPRACNTCKHGWVAHALDKLGLRHLYNCNQVEIVQPNIVFDIASLMLYGCQATPIRLKILLDRLFSVLQHDEVLQILNGFGWGYEDYARGYILQDTQGNVLDKWILATREEEPLILQQFLRFGETKAITQQIILQDSSERTEYTVSSAATSESDIKRFIERTNRASIPFYRQGGDTFGLPERSSSKPSPQQQQQPPPPPHPANQHSSGGRSKAQLARLPSTGSGHNMSPNGSSQQSFDSPVNCTSPLSISPLNRLQNMQPYDFRLDRGGASPDLIRASSGDHHHHHPSAFHLQSTSHHHHQQPPPHPHGAHQPHGNASSGANNSMHHHQQQQQPSQSSGHLVSSGLSLHQLPMNCSSPPVTPSAGPSISTLGTSLAHSSNSSVLANSDLSMTDGDSDEDTMGSAVLNLSRRPTTASDSIYATKKVKHLRKSANPMKRRWNPGMMHTMVSQGGGGSGSNHSSGKKRVQCNVCLKTFCDKGALKIHFSAVHLKEMHKCTVAGCSMMFSSRRSRNRHSANPNPKLHSPHLRRKISPHDGRSAFSTSGSYYMGGGGGGGSGSGGLAPSPLESTKMHHREHHRVVPMMPMGPLSMPPFSASAAMLMDQDDHEHEHQHHHSKDLSMMKERGGRSSRSPSSSMPDNFMCRPQSVTPTPPCSPVDPCLPEVEVRVPHGESSDPADDQPLADLKRPRLLDMAMGADRRHDHDELSGDGSTRDIKPNGLDRTCEEKLDKVEKDAAKSCRDIDDEARTPVSEARCVSPDEDHQVAPVTGNGLEASPASAVTTSNSKENNTGLNLVINSSNNNNNNKVVPARKRKSLNPTRCTITANKDDIQFVSSDEEGGAGVAGADDSSNDTFLQNDNSLDIGSREKVAAVATDFKKDLKDDFKHDDKSLKSEDDDSDDKGLDDDDLDDMDLDDDLDSMDDDDDDDDDLGRIKMSRPSLMPSDRIKLERTDGSEREYSPREQQQHQNQNNHRHHHHHHHNHHQNHQVKREGKLLKKSHSASGGVRTDVEETSEIALRHLESLSQGNFGDASHFSLRSLNLHSSLPNSLHLPLSALHPGGLPMDSFRDTTSPRLPDSTVPGSSGPLSSHGAGGSSNPDSPLSESQPLPGFSFRDSAMMGYSGDVPVDKENPRRCTACGKIFQNHFGVKTHYQNVHLKLMHKCTVDGCNAAFPSKRSRDRHSANLNLHRKLLSTTEKSFLEKSIAFASLAGSHTLRDEFLSRIYGESPVLPLSISELYQSKLSHSIVDSVINNNDRGMHNSNHFGSMHPLSMHGGGMLLPGGDGHHLDLSFSGFRGGSPPPCRSPSSATPPSPTSVGPPQLSGPPNVSSEPTTPPASSHLFASAAHNLVYSLEDDLPSPDANGNFPCKFCHKRFQDGVLLKDHYEKIHLPEMFRCTVNGCNKIFSSQKKRNQHSQNSSVHSHVSIES